MKRITLVAAAIVTCAVACRSQTCYEAIGQTTAFTLKAGAKSGPAAIRGIFAMRDRINSGISVTTTRDGILVTLPSLQRGIAEMAVYDVAGRLIFRQRGFSGTSLRLETRTFAPGIYTMRVQVDGQSYLRRFAVSR